MRHKFLGTGEPGYHPLKKLRTIGSGLRYAVVYDFSVAWKLVFSLCVLVAALSARAWVTPCSSSLSRRWCWWPKS